MSDITIPKNELEIYRFCSTEHARYAICGVEIERSGHKQFLRATDGITFVELEKKCADEAKDQKFVVDATDFKAAIKIAEPRSDPRVYHEDEAFHSCGSVVPAKPMLKDKLKPEDPDEHVSFPDFSGIKSKGGRDHFCVDANKLVKMLQSIIKICGKEVAENLCVEVPEVGDTVIHVSVDSGNTKLQAGVAVILGKDGRGVQKGRE